MVFWELDETLLFLSKHFGLSPQTHNPTKSSYYLTISY